MALQGLVDWRGRPVNQKRHGGVKASMFIHFLIVMANIANIPMILNLVSYLLGTMHMGVKDASTTSTNFFGAICFFSFLGAFVSDSYIKRFYTILVFAPIEIMGYVLLAVQAYHPSLHPPPCDMLTNPSKCIPVSGRNLSLLTLGLYLVPIGEGSLRSCAAALGGDQFDGDDPAELHGKISFFNWFAFCISLGGFIGLVFLVWVENNRGWGLSFVIAAIMLLVGTTVVSAGLPFYRHQKPMGSPLTRILQVFVAAFRKRKLSLPEDLTEMHAVTDSTGTSTNSEVLERTSGFKFLDKAAVNDGDRRRWSLCTVTQVEEAKIMIRMLPIFLSSILGNVPIPLLLSLTVQQGATMDTHLGATTMPPASLFVVPIVFQMLTLIIYDRAFVPWLRRATGIAGGVTHLQRVGVGFVFGVMALAVAALVEGRRRNSGDSTAMSVFWLTPQFFLLGVMDVTSFVGLLEFFYSEASAGMKTIGGAIVFCILGVASWLGSLLIQVVNRATARRGGGHGWLDGASLNASRLDLFYWLLAIFGLVSFFLYLLCAWRYTYRHDPRMQTAIVVDEVSSSASTKDQATV